MATIDINLSAAIVNQQNGRPQGADLSDAFGLFFQAANTFSTAHPYYSTYSQVGNTLRLNYSDGGYSNYSNVTLANPGATSGSATATNLEHYFPSAYRLTVNGTLNYDYTAAAGGPNFQGKGGTINAAAIQTLVPSYSASYDKDLGNVTLGIQGNIGLTANGDINGVITSLTGKADKSLLSSSLTGSFNVNGNALNIAQNLDSLHVSGTASGYSEKYSDGSSINLSNIAIGVNGDSTLGNALLANGDNFGGDDVFNISLGATPASAWNIASGAGNDKITLKGGAGALNVNAGTGNDTIALLDRGHSVNGGDGTDTVIYNEARAGYTITKTSSGFSVSNSAGTDVLSNVERLQFSDTTIALDVNGTGGQAYRLYQAAFNRTPDAAGLGYWVKQMDNGQSLRDVASNFMSSKEFNDLYGSKQSNSQFLDSLYQNVLHRAGDQAGHDWWLAQLNSGITSRPQVLADFGESTENQAALIGVIGNGFSYTEYHG